MVNTSANRVDPSNDAQARAWDGGEGTFWSANADRFDRSVAAYNEPLLTAASLDLDARVLDVGCGTGETTRAAARIASAGSAVGVDLSAQMIEVARATSELEGVANIGFVQADAQVHPFAAASFDAVISRTGSMFFGDPVAAFTNLAMALRPGGRLAMLVWQSLPRNEWLREISTALAAGRDLPRPPADAPGPFALSDPDRVRRLLAASGFADPQLDGLERPMWFGDAPEDAQRFILGVSGWMLDGLDDSGRARALDNLRASLEARHTDQGVRYDSATWLVTAERA